MAGIADEIRESFKRGSAVTKLIYINLGIFLALRLLGVFVFLIYRISDESFKSYVLDLFAFPAQFDTLLIRPWTLFSYQFLHWGFLHILGNLLWLFWFGRIFIRYLSQKQMYTTYLLGGIAGAALYFIAYSIFPVFNGVISNMHGASASVTAIVIAIAVFTPNYTVYLPFIGPVKIKHIAMVYLALDILLIPADGNPGGHIAHLGGAIYGYFFAARLKRGKDIGKGFSTLSDFIVTLFKRKPKMKVTYKSGANQMDDLEYNKAKVEYQKEIDRILDKIAKSGYDSLSKKEKETLFRMSNKS